MRSALRQPAKLVNLDLNALHASIPTFLCPVLLSAPIILQHRVNTTCSSKRFLTLGRAHQQAFATLPSPESPKPQPFPAVVSQQRKLPRACPGCGAPTQVFDKDEAGYYNIDRRVVKEFLDYAPSKEMEMKEEGNVYTETLKKVDAKLLEELGVEKEALDAPNEAEKEAPETPVCDRCHNLIHHRVGLPILHPTLDAIQQIIAESPHRRNHVYHVLDAADFPLSIIPNLQASLHIPKLRTRNRRAKHKGWVANDRIAEVSFIITRADLLAPKKEQVDKLMPYMQDVLRDALGRVNKKARLGNVRLVSAKRGWWTKQVKEDIWERGGAGWMVGKVNVGKSNLFEVVFPKGRGEDYQNVRKIRTEAEREAMLNNAKSIEEVIKVQKQLAEEDAEIERRKNEPRAHVHEPPEPEEVQEEEEETNALLPPPQPYTPYPVLPIASSLPGTTASPIRIPFGHNRGELIDLPGLARTTPGLETFVQPSEHNSLVMKHRINAERLALKPGQSLILGGGLIRITPITQDLVFLVHPFVPITPHVTRTDKAIDYQGQTSERNLTSILAENVGEKMKSAGRFKLKWDVSKKIAGPLTSPIAAKMRPENLPFRIWSTDILIEGVGWVEISAQMRRPQGWKPVGMVKKDPNHAQKAKFAARQKILEKRQKKYEGDTADEEHVPEKDEFGGDKRFWDEEYPEVEVFSPLGKYVGARMPMCASAVSGPKRVPSRERKARPRRSMVSVKRQRKPAERGSSE